MNIHTSPLKLKLPCLSSVSNIYSSLSCRFPNRSIRLHSHQIRQRGTSLQGCVEVQACYYHLCDITLWPGPIPSISSTQNNGHKPKEASCYLHSCSVNSGMLQCYMLTKVLLLLLPAGVFSSIASFTWLATAAWRQVALQKKLFPVQLLPRQPLCVFLLSPIWSQRPQHNAPPPFQWMGGLAFFPYCRI